MSRLFGTDSAKGAVVADLSCEVAMQAGRASAAVISGSQEKRSKIIIAKDGRLSSDILEAAICAGICSAGADAEGVGTIPAPAAAWLTKERGADACIMIAAAGTDPNASGIRIFSPEGRRFGTDIEEQIESLVFGIGAGSVLSRPSAEMGRMLRYDNGAEEYIEHVCDLVPTCLSGMKVALGCSESCTSVTAEKLFKALGAEVLMLPETDSDFDPDIETASTSLERLMEYVPAYGCDCGFVFDNEGFGCRAVDETGKLTDGDSLLAIFAKSFKEREKLRGNSIVVNCMSGLGLFNFARDNGINVLTSGAADRYILDRMLEEECSLGGERSGHIIFLDDCPVGDGQLCGARLLEIMKVTRKKLSELAGEMQKLPQIVLNVRIDPRKREIWKNDSVITDLVKANAEKLGSEGRVIVREAYGSDPFIRVVIEGRDFGEINEMAMEIAKTIKARCA
ncbi:MAG: phosphoglucosamine mutase [Ruminococcus sp.]|nr:phosphoglucosamine mutase [Ruminococcus sp.]